MKYEWDAIQNEIYGNKITFNACDPQPHLMFNPFCSNKISLNY